MLTITILLVGISIIIGTIYLLATHASKGPTEAAVSFVTAVQNNDPKTAYALTALSFKQAVNQSDFTKILTAQNATLTNGKIAVVDQKTKTSDGRQSANIGVNIGTGAETMNATVQLEKNGNAWMVSNVSFGKGPYAGSTLDLNP